MPRGVRKSTVCESWDDNMLIILITVRLQLARWLRLFAAHCAFTWHERCYISEVLLYCLFAFDVVIVIKPEIT